MTNDRDVFIEELAEEMWEERCGFPEGSSWSDVDLEVQRKFRRFAAETLRILEHGPG
jgi:hypothetical protein